MGSIWEKVEHGENKIWECETCSDCVYNSGKIACCQCVLKKLKSESGVVAGSQLENVSPGLQHMLGKEEENVSGVY